MGISEATMMLQTISQSGAGISGAQSIHANVYATQPVAKFATADQKNVMLLEIINGQVKVCFGVTEPRSGVDRRLYSIIKSDDNSYQTTAQDLRLSNSQLVQYETEIITTSPARRSGYHLRKSRRR